MARKNVNYYLTKTARLTGWLLFLLVIGYIVTGFAMRGDFGLNDYLSAEIALGIHQLFLWPMIVIFSVHSAVTIYFAFRRWGWIGKRAKATGPRDRPGH